MTTAQFWHRLQELLRLCFKKTSSTEKMSRDLRAALFPGSGAVESLNVASATAVLLAQWASHRG